MLNLNILIVEDEDDHRALTVRLVKKAAPAAAIMEANTVEEAMRLLEQDQSVNLSS